MADYLVLGLGDGLNAEDGYDEATLANERHVMHPRRAADGL